MTTARLGPLTSMNGTSAYPHEQKESSMYRLVICFGVALSACGEATEYSSPLSAGEMPHVDECSPGDRRINADGARFHCDDHGQWARGVDTLPEGGDGSESPHTPKDSDDAGLDDGDGVGDADRGDLNTDGSNTDDSNTDDPNTDDPNPEAQCPEGALWLDQPIPGNENGAEGLADVTFEPNESKYFCSRLPPERGNAKRYTLGASGLGNDHTCESLLLEVVSVPEESTMDHTRLSSGVRGSRNPYLRLAFYLRDADVGMDAPPGLYVMKATEMFGVRDPGQRICRRFQVYKLVTYP